VTAQAGDGIPGYCESCREFRLLARVEVPAVGAGVSVCRNCATLGPDGLAWQVAGIGEDGEFGADPSPLTQRRIDRAVPWLPHRDRLAESLVADEGGEGGGFGRGRIRRRDRWRDRAWLLRERLRALR
jgi:hypothetical protein